MDLESTLSPSLPLYALLPLLFASLLLIAIQAKRSGSEALAFVTVALGLRVVLAAGHEFTFTRSPIGLSWNALASVALCFGGILVLRRKSGAKLIVIPTAIMISLMLASSLINRSLTVGAGDQIKFAYFAVVASLVAQSCHEVGAQRAMTALLPVSMLPLLFQLIGTPLGIVKAGEADGSASYIGGFHHEAAFSVLLMSSVLLVSLVPKMKLSVRTTLLTICFISLILANYRTSIIGALPVAGIVLITSLSNKIAYNQRRFVAPLVALAVLGAGLGLAATQEERYADITTILHRGTGLIQRPEVANPDDGKLLSGRIAIWSWYYYGWKDSSTIQRFIGHGPNTWSQVFPYYAHNTIISALYELGLAGTLTYIIIFTWFLGLSMLAQPDFRPALVASHVGFLLLNQATMPMWMIEGMIYYAILCGVTIHNFKQARLRTNDTYASIEYIRPVDVSLNTGRFGIN
jgi:hypothetical protein